MKKPPGSMVRPFNSSSASTWPDFSADGSSNSREVIVDRKLFTEARFYGSWTCKLHNRVQKS